LAGKANILAAKTSCALTAREYQSNTFTESYFSRQKKKRFINNNRARSKNAPRMRYLVSF